MFLTINGKKAQMSKKGVLDLLNVQQDLLKKKVSLLTPMEFSRLFQKPKWETKILLRLAVKNNLLTRVKRGIYLLNAQPPAAFEIANMLLSPSYLSLETALSYYRIIPEVVYPITSLTTKPPKEFSKFNRTYVYSKINSKLFFGYSKVRIGAHDILMAEREKALLDYFYFVAIGRKAVHERFDFSNIDRSKIQGHLPYFQQAMKGRKLTTFMNLIKKYL